LAGSDFALFTSGDVSASSSSVTAGDVMGALFVGGMAYVLIVVFFAIGLFSMAKFYMYNPNNSGADPTNGMTLLRLATKPILWLVMGIIILTVVSIFLESAFSIDVKSRIKFFFEARYSTMMPSLVIAPKFQGVGESLMVVVDISSKFCFWTMYGLVILMYLACAVFILSLFFHKSNDESAFKKVVTGLLTLLVSIGVIGFLSNSINSFFFSSSLNIQNVGVLSTFQGGMIQVVKYFISLSGMI
jgi:hypothetical protein